jgi:long-chain acyl-CoA synthetase
VGPPVPGTEVRILDPDPVTGEGEILIRGRSVMRGYHKLPEMTAEVLSSDGWLRTGDIGTVDAGNFLTITDRKKDLIKTSGGKFVTPQNLEGKLKMLLPLIGHVLIHGDRRPYCTAIIALDPEALNSWATDKGLHDLSFAQLAQSPAVQSLVQDAVNKLNASVARFETIKKFAVVASEFTIESGDLTPTQKVKRHVVEEKYKTTLDAFYAA